MNGARSSIHDRDASDAIRGHAAAGTAATTEVVAAGTATRAASACVDAPGAAMPLVATTTAAASSRTSRRSAAVVAIVMTIVAFVMPFLVPSFGARTALAAPTATTATTATAAAGRLAAGSVTTPLNISLGSNINQSSPAGPDTGVATWVGRDLYVGAPPKDQSAPYTYTNANGPTGSYTAEVEGLTIVKGKFANHKLGNSWGGNGLHMGAVGFGTMFRPANGAQALGVAGVNTHILSMTTGPNRTTYGDVGAWEHGAFVGKGQASGTVQFTAAISGNQTNWNTSVATNPRSSVVQTAGAYSPTPGVTFNAPNPLTANGVDYTNYGEQTVIPLSDKLISFNGYAQQSGDVFTTAPADAKPGVYIGAAPGGTYTRNHYSNPAVSHTWHFSGANSERLITFNGDGSSLMQVFTIDASQMNSTGFSGLDFAFTNIPDDAAVVVNITGAAPVTFQSGWRFWWNGTEIGNGYASNATAVQKSDYNTAAQAIMWNFANTSDLTVLGGAYGSTAISEAADTAKIGTRLAPGDDPAAAMLGSIIVPRGSFDDHVITNGRVYVGGDYRLDSPIYVGTYNNADSASIIGMDQERHNYPWRGMQPAALISWSKVNAGNGQPLAGSTWEVFGDLRSALSGSGAILTVKDNDPLDVNKADGVFELGLLTPNATYYLRELTPPDGYRLNDNIYRIDTGAASDTPYTTIVNVYNNNGMPVSGGNRLLIDTSASGLVSPAIGDRPYGGDVSWSKYADGDASRAGLPGSSWTLKNVTNPNSVQTYTIDDNTTVVQSVQILDANGAAIPGNALTMTAGGSVRLTAKALPDGAPQQVTWSVSPSDVVGVQNGVVTSYGQLTAPTKVTVTATTVDTTQDGKHLSASVAITVSPAAVTALTLNRNGTVAPATLDADVADGTVRFTATTTPTGSAVTWTSSDPAVASVDADGLVTLKAAGTATITVRSGDLTKSVTLHVANNALVIYFNTQTAGVNYMPFLAWKTTSQTNYTYALMSQYCDGWYRTVVPSKNAGVQFYFRSANGATYMATGGQTPFAAAPGARSIAVYLYDKVQPGVTPECATALAARPPATMTAASSDVRDDGVFAANAAKRKTLAAKADEDKPTYTDVNTAIGGFTLKHLPAGTYTLQEKTPPSGYLLNPAVYRFTIDANGVVSWVGDDKPSLVGDDKTGWISDVPSSVVWAKVDGGYDGTATAASAPLAGSAWALERKGADGSWQTVNVVDDCEHAPCDASKVTYPDVDATPGAFRIDKLPLGTYRIVESVIPDGYQSVGGPYEFTIDDATQATVQVAGGTIANRRRTGSVIWTKTDATEPTKQLAGAEWGIIYTPKGSTTSQTYTITDCTGDGDCAVAGNPAWAKDVDATPGAFKLTGLQWGAYTLRETKAPAGYDLAPGTHSFVVGPADDGTVALDWDLKAIQDEPGVVLPATGGTGDARRMILLGCTLIGLALMGCAFVMRTRTTSDAAEGNAQPQG